MNIIGAMLWSEMIDIFFEIRQPRKRMASDAFGDELDIPGPCTAARDMIARYGTSLLPHFLLYSYLNALSHSHCVSRLTSWYQSTLCTCTVSSSNRIAFICSSY